MSQVSLCSVTKDCGRPDIFFGVVDTPSEAFFTSQPTTDLLPYPCLLIAQIDNTSFTSAAITACLWRMSYFVSPILSEITHETNISPDHSKTKIYKWRGHFVFCGLPLKKTGVLKLTATSVVLLGSCLS